LGTYISGYLSPKWIKLIGGSLFIIIGILMVFKH
jgi:putative Ca2+/H+ antiporter (TMEM165/GDT1 family)